MQFLAKIWPNNRLVHPLWSWCTPLWEILDPSLDCAQIYIFGIQNGCETNFAILIPIPCTYGHLLHIFFCSHKWIILMKQTRNWSLRPAHYPLFSNCNEHKLPAPGTAITTTNCSCRRNPVCTRGNSFLRYSVHPTCWTRLGVWVWTLFRLNTPFVMWDIWRHEFCELHVLRNTPMSSFSVLLRPTDSLWFRVR